MICNVTPLDDLCLTQGPRFWAGVVASIFVILCYIAAGIARPRNPDQGWQFNPLVITAGVFGRASLANLQILFFSLIVFWVLVYGILWAGELGSLSEHVLYLLGIGALGTAGAKVTSIHRKRLSFENLGWLKHKKWIERDIGKKRRPPTWPDLVTTDDAFDVFKFQNVVVSLVIGMGLFGLALSSQDAGALAKFEIPDSLLGLLGLSQVTYISGKAIAPPANADLNKKLNELRDLERKFIQAVAASPTWIASATKSADDAKLAATTEYNAYISIVKETKIMLEEIVGNLIPEPHTEPDLPKQI